MKIEKRCFLQWFILTISYISCAIFAWRFGFIQDIWYSDVTHITSLIALIFILSINYLGITSWRVDENNIQAALADATLIRTVAFLVTLVGLLGTVIGLSLQVKAMGSLDVSQPTNIAQFIATVGSSLSTALYSTICGIISCVGLTVMNSNVEYFIDRKERP